MSQTIQQPDGTSITLNKSTDYRDTYANSVQVRLSVWDFLLVFGTLGQSSETNVEIENFQGIYVSPQQAKALHNILAHNLQQYEQAFGTISLDPPQQQQQPQGGPRIVPGGGNNGPIH